MKSIYLILLSSFMLMISGFNYSADRIISGTVIDKTDQTGIPGVKIILKGSAETSITDQYGKFKLKVPQGKEILQINSIGYKSKEIKLGKSDVILVQLEPLNNTLTEMISTSMDGKFKVPKSIYGIVTPISGSNAQFKSKEQIYNTESYNAINENRFLEVKQNPLSTFGIDVDVASYSNIRRFINKGEMPPIDAVRIEEMINYFNYDYPQPQTNDPLSVHTEISSAPWNAKHRLVKIGLQGKTIATDKIPASNLVFLIDVSGSMDMPAKLPLVKSSMKLMVDQLRSQDRVAIVVYADAVGLVLKSTPGNQKEIIKKAIDGLEAGGSTAGGAGIELAYITATENFLKQGNNRVILATDGDFNMGVSSDAEMHRMIEEKRKTGIYLTALGFGMGNYKDSKLETLADKGNGNYAYIDNMSEARKTLVKEFGGTIFTIANDVKLQVEFNPGKVQAYRLIGYENRMLNKEDFNNDKKDAGDLGSGHTVTALYEIIPTGVNSDFIEKVESLKYQKQSADNRNSKSDELLTVKIRYKKPGQDESKLMEKPVADQQISWNNSSENYRFASAVAAYGMILRNSEFKNKLTFTDVIQWAEGALGNDREGYRAEFIKLVKSSNLMAKELLSVSQK
ncbi:vWA domain-containing protein [Daejeonella oryzae]|uniref:vWA domain-containing protein n=1 Tax=Daejeonella oryzae TaxID=1122943 RepID=UPI00047B1CD8|nr:VWA domain-containing protein [Daejeonella oryzae]